MPVPTTKEELESFQRIRWEEAHITNERGKYWNLEDPEFWLKVCKTFHREVLDTGGKRVLPLPSDTQTHEAAVKALVRLARAAFEGQERDFTGLWYWLLPVLNESGGTEILDDGFLHSDKLRFALRYFDHRAFHQREHYLDVEPDLTAFTLTQITQAIYESTVNMGVVFICALINMAAGQKHPIWKRAFRNRSYVGVPYLDQSAAKALKLLRHRGSKTGLSKSEIQALEQFLEAIDRRPANGKATADLRDIRDAIAHARYEISTNGKIVLDVYEHMIANRFGRLKGRRWSPSYPYGYRVIGVKEAENNLGWAVAYSAAIWAMYREVYREGQFRTGKQLNHPSPRLKKSALERLKPLRVGVEAKRLAKEKRRQEESRFGVEVKSVKVEPLPADDPSRPASKESRNSQHPTTPRSAPRPPRADSHGGLPQSPNSEQAH